MRLLLRGRRHAARCCTAPKQARLPRRPPIAQRSAISVPAAAAGRRALVRPVQAVAGVLRGTVVLGGQGSGAVALRPAVALLLLLLLVLLPDQVAA